MTASRSSYTTPHQPERHAVALNSTTPSAVRSTQLWRHSRRRRGRFSVETSTGSHEHLLGISATSSSCVLEYFAGRNEPRGVAAEDVWSGPGQGRGNALVRDVADDDPDPPVGSSMKS